VSETRPSISGVVNTCAAATAINGDTITLGGATNPFQPNDRVLVIQMAGAVIDTSDTDKFGTITNNNGVGRREQRGRTGREALVRRARRF
jgi:hypothetical protein